MLAHPPEAAVPGSPEPHRTVTQGTGVSARATARVLAAMVAAARDGTVQISGSELALRAGYSGSAVARAQRHLVDLGAIRRLAIGGGRAETLWRVDPDVAATIVRPDDVRSARPVARQRGKVLAQRAMEES